MLVNDSFDRVDSSVLGTTDTGQAWTENRGNWGIISNAAYIQDGSGFGYIGAVASVDCGDTVQDVSALINAQAAPGTSAGIALRLSDGNNFWFAMLYSTSGPGALRLFAGKVVANVGNYVITSDQAVGATFPAILRMTVNASNVFRVYLAGTLVSGPYTDTVPFNATATRVGINLYDTADRFNSFGHVPLSTMKQRLGIPI